MLFLALLTQILFSWSKEVQSISFADQTIPFCGRNPSWLSVLPQLSSKEIDCMDLAGPLSGGDPNFQGANQTQKRQLELDRPALVNLLKKSRIDCFKQSEWHIPAKLTFLPQPKLSEELFEAWLQQQLQKEFEGRQFEIAKLQLPRIDCGNVDQLKWGSFRIEGRNTFRFLLLIDDNNFGVTGEFRIFQNIPVAQRNINANEKIAASDFAFQRKEITFSPGFVTKSEDLIGRLLRQPVSQGSPIQIQYLKPETTIEKGQIIQAQYLGENFVLTSSAIAEQSGSVGDLVKIKNLESQKILSGIVLSQGLVEVR